jgi:hypothetical protein
MVTNEPGAAPGPATVGALRQDLRDLIGEAQAVRRDVKHDQEQRRRATRVAMGLAALFAVMIVLILVLAWQNNRIAEDARRTSELLTDCTVPGGKCYEQGSKRTGAAVGAIGRTQLYIVECSRETGEGSGPAWDARFEKCVADRLKRPAPPR